MHTQSISTITRSRLRTFADDLATRRRARRARLDLRRELSSYRTPAEVNDILAAMHHEGGSHDEQVSQMLLHNLSLRSRYVA